MRKFGQMPCAIWRSELTKPARLLYAYLCTSPHSNMLGGFNCPPEYIAGDTGLRPRVIAAAEADLIARGYLVRFGDWVYLPRFTSENPVHSGNNAKHRVGLWAEIESEHVRTAVAADMLARNADLPEELREAFRVESTVGSTVESTVESTLESTVESTLESTLGSRGIDREIESNTNPPPYPPLGGGAEEGPSDFALGNSEPVPPPDAEPKTKRFRRKAALAEVSALPVPPELDTPQFRELWPRWVEYRIDYSPKPPNPLRFFGNQLETIPKKFSGPSEACAALERAMLNGWRGFDFAADKSAQTSHSAKSTFRPPPSPAFA